MNSPLTESTVYLLSCKLMGKSLEKFYLDSGGIISLVEGTPITKIISLNNLYCYLSLLVSKRIAIVSHI